MSTTYDTYYKTGNLFGAPYPELITFFSQYPERGKVLDLGCGQGRDAIALARLGFTVTGIDNSKVGIDQMNKMAVTENLDIEGQVGDIYAFDEFEKFDMILLDSMFHFTKKSREKEMGLIRKMISRINKGSLVVICIQDTREKVRILNESLNFEKPLRRLVDKKFTYTFEDQESEHKSITDYRMIIVTK